MTKEVITWKIRDNIHRTSIKKVPSEFFYLTEFGSAWISRLGRHHYILKSRLIEELILDKQS